MRIEDKETIKNKLESLRCIHQDSGCWEFLGHIKKGGYGNIAISKRNYSTHRLSLYIYKDFDLNSDLQALHIIECKRRDCFNPEHLYAGTHTNNMQDLKQTTGNWQKRKLVCKNGHLFSKENTLLDKKGHRTCKICANLLRKTWRKNEAIKIVNLLKT